MMWEITMLQGSDMLGRSPSARRSMATTQQKR